MGISADKRKAKIKAKEDVREARRQNISKSLASNISEAQEHQMAKRESDNLIVNEKSSQCCKNKENFD